MINIDKQRIGELIRTDLISLSKGKIKMKNTLMIMTVFFTLMGFFISPLMGMYVSMILSGFMANMIFMTDVKYHSEKMYSVLPIARHELVIARFLLTNVIGICTSIIFYLLMLLSMELKLYTLLPDWVDMLELLAERTSFTEKGLFDLIYFGCMSFGILMNASSLQKGFRDSSNFGEEMTFTGGKDNRYLKRDIRYLVIIFGILAIVFLTMNGVLPLGSAAVVIMSIIVQLMQAADGVFFCLIMVASSIMAMVYKCICTVLEYDDRDI